MFDKFIGVSVLVILLSSISLGVYTIYKINSTNIPEIVSGLVK